MQTIGQIRHSQAEPAKPPTKAGTALRSMGFFG
jgi:hypothetical protein